MCNLYSAGPAPHHSRSRWEKQVREAIEELESQRIFPGNNGVVARSVDGEPRAITMSWGFQREFANRPINNARDDKLEGRMWGKAFRESRCVIPVRWFVEWHQFERTASGKKRILSFREKEGFLWMAGIWEEQENRNFYSMITTGPSKQIESIHNRMPAILPTECIEEYLSSEQPPFELIRPYEGPLEIRELEKSTDDPEETLLL